MSNNENQAIVLSQPQNTQVQALEDFTLSTETIIARKRTLNAVMQSVMKENVHFGVIPNCGKKPSLLKPGAEAIASTFQLCPKYEINKIELSNGHRELDIVCNLYTPNGSFVGSGVGSCSTMEGKYRFRTGEGESTGIPVPKSYWDNRTMAVLKAAANSAGFEGDKFGTKKFDGKWMITTHGERVEHDNPADYYNTCLKMGKKRAFVDAVLTATGASDIFTQDVEDMPETIPGAQGFNQQRQGNASAGMDDIPDYDQGPPSLSDAQKRKVFGVCKGKNIDLNALCQALTDSSSFGHPVKRVTELTSSEASALIGWLEEGQLDHLQQAAA